ncbi:hypothetical protein WB44_11540 [Synechococcus sp. WH 8020]|nr:hypothetical protein WB44_11540 [Synechococcus sp. WH 8020]
MINDLPALKLLAQRFIRKITAITFTLLNDFEGSIIGVLSHGAAPNKSSERFQISIAETAVFSTVGVMYSGRLENILTPRVFSQGTYLSSRH